VSVDFYPCHACPAAGQGWKHLFCCKDGTGLKKDSSRMTFFFDMEEREKRKVEQRIDEMTGSM